MNDIKVTVNLATFAVAVLVWLALGVLTALPGYTLAPSLSFLFATLTGVILTIVQGFEKGITFKEPLPTVPDLAGTINQAIADVAIAQTKGDPQ